MAIKFLNTVAVDTDVLYVDASNNRVGIGTDSPNHELVVQGTSSPNIELKNSNYSDGGFVLNRTNYNQQWKWWAQSSQMYFGFSTNESTYSNKMTIQSGGNVGIGTTSPAAKLEVEQSNSGTGTVFLSNSYNNKGFRTGNAGYATFSGYQDGNNTTSGNAYGALIGLNTFYNGTSFYNDNQYVDPSSILFKDGDIKFHTNDISATGNFTPNERLRITKTGNVGIGTTSPSEKLHVHNGSAYITPIAYAANQNDWVIRAGAYNSTSFDQGLKLKSSSGGASYMAFETTGSTETMVLRSGNVGIGTNSPGQKLEVEGNIRISKSNDITSGFELGRDGSTLDAFIIQRENADLFFRTNNSERMRIEAGGNVGIGATNPSTKLQVSGTVKSEGLDVDGQANSSTNFLQYTRTDLTQPASISYDGTGGFDFNLNGGIVKFSDTNGGSVGIGTTSPVDKLDVRGTARITAPQANDWIVLAQNYATGAPSGFWDSNGNVHLYLRDSSSNTNVLIRPDSTSYLNGGNVGIGTTSPGEKLEVNGTVKATAATDAYKGYIKNTITCTPLMKTANTDYNYIPYNSTIFGSTPAYYNRMAAAYDGRVKKIILRHVDGVTPTATGMKFKKEVNGTVSTTEYTATVTGGASANFTAIYNFANSDFTFSEGDSIAILAQTSGGTGSIGGVSVQIIVEYNIT